MSDQPPSFPFLVLPRELRDHIYSHVFSSPEYKDNSSRPSHASLHRTKLVRQKYGWKISRNSELNRVYFPESRLSPTSAPKNTHRLPALCYVSRQLHQESVPLYLRCCTIISHSMETTEWLSAWLGQFPRSVGFLGVISLQLSITSEIESQQYGLIERCVNLRELRIVFGKFKDSDNVRTIEEFAQLYQFLRILDIPKLDIFIFEDRWHGMRVPMWREHHVSMQEWFVNCWKMRGRDVVVINDVLPPAFPAR